MSKFKLGILISGNGSNMQAIIDNINTNTLNAEISIVISDNKEALGLKRAEQAGIKSIYINPGKFKTKLEPEIEQEYINCLKEHNVDLVCLAGFMRIIKDSFINSFPNKIINIHPALLPSFPGLNAQKQAFDYSVKVSGCTVHFVDNKIDNGPIIMQKTVPVLDNDTEESLKQKILEQEHKLYSKCIQLIADKKIKIEKRKVTILS
jgi:phosphoribosylglycinamide formyltransferase 1